MSYDYLDTVPTKNTYNIVFIVDLSYQLISPYEISYHLIIFLHTNTKIWYINKM